MFKRALIVLMTALLAFSVQSASARPSSTSFRQAASKSRGRSRGKYRSKPRRSSPRKSRGSSGRTKRRS